MDRGLGTDRVIINKLCYTTTFVSNIVVSVNERWKSLRNALAGLFCASVGSLDEMRTTSPVYAFRPEGNLPISLASFSQNQTEKKDHDYELRHASLPAEHVCTENLTPFLKLLPCKGSS